MAVFMKRDRYLLEKPYEELMYIESTGTQYIDTMFIPSAKTKIVADCQFTNTSSQYSGIYISPSMVMFGISTKYQFYIGDKYINASAATTNRTIFTLDIPQKRALVDDVIFDVAYTKFTVPAYSLPIFVLRASATSYRSYCKMKLYEYKIYDNNVLVRYFVPVRIKLTGEIGLLDKVNSVFYGNAGTGTFVAGEVAA